MLAWLSWSGCVFGTTTPEGADETDPTEVVDDGEGLVVEYAPDYGFACVDGPAGSGTTVLVDFRDCLFCSTDSTLWCDATFDGDTTIVVHGGGSVLIDDDCTTIGTCEPTHALCAGPDLAAGDYTLSYGGVEVPFTVPANTWSCTGPSGIL